MYIKHSRGIVNKITKAINDNYTMGYELALLTNAINIVGVELHQKTSKEILDCIKLVLESEKLRYDEEKVNILLGLASYLGITWHEIEELASFVLFMYEQTTGYSTKDIEENEYFKNIKVPHKTKDKFSLSYEKHIRGDLFSDKEPGEAEYLYIPSCGYYKDDLKYPIITENRNVWMSITPNEINTMEEHIDLVSGNVLTLGLGLGYYQYMIHLKENVKKVIVIEREQAVIDLFKENILPQFKYPEKIEIIQEDAFKYLEKLNGDEYDYCFCDIWKDCLEAIPLYLKLKKIENKFSEMEKAIKFSYWIENSILMQIKLLIPGILQEELYGNANKEIKKVLSSITEIDEIKKVLKNEKITYPDNVRKLFTYDYLKQILKNYK